MIPSDAECISRCLAGNTQCFRTLLSRYEQPLRAYIRGRVPRGIPADDVAQEAFVRAFFSLSRLVQARAFFPWLLGISDFVIKEFSRTQTRHRLALTHLAQQRQFLHSSAPQDTSDPELNRAVAALADPYRQIVLLRYYGELSCQEIADRLQMPLGSVTKYLSRAYAALRESLTPAVAPALTTAAAVNHSLLATTERMGRSHDL